MGQNWSLLKCHVKVRHVFFDSRIGKDVSHILRHVESEASIQVRPIEQLIGFVASVAPTQIHVVRVEEEEEEADMDAQRNSW